MDHVYNANLGVLHGIALIKQKAKAMKAPVKLFFSTLAWVFNIYQHGFRGFQIANKVILVKGLIQFLVYCASAQTANNSQFYNTTLTLNPAMSSVENSPTLQLNYSIRMNGIADDFSRYQTALVYPLFSDKDNRYMKSRNGTLGFNVLHETSGPGQSFTTTQLSASYAYTILLDGLRNHNLSFALGGNYYSENVDLDALQWGQQYQNPNTGVSESVLVNNSNVFDFNLGLLWFYHNRNQSGIIEAANLGLAIDHLNRPNESYLEREEVRKELEFRVHGSMVMAMNHANNLSLNMMLSKEGEYYQYNFGTYFSHEMLYQNTYLFVARLGLWYRLQESVVALLEFETAKLKLAFSMDMNEYFDSYNQSVPGSLFQVHVDFRIDHDFFRTARY